MDDRLDEILHRLRDLDHRLARLEREHGRGEPDRGPRDGRDSECRDRDDRDRACRDRDDRDRACRGRDRDDREHGRHRDRRDDDRDRGFDERRVIDTIVRLTCENLEPILTSVVARELDRRAPPREGEPPEPAR